MLSNAQLIMLGILFFIVANPMAYEQVDKFVNVENANGPTQMGVGIHAVVFMILALLLTRLKLPSKAAKYLKLQ